MILKRLLSSTLIFSMMFFSPYAVSADPQINCSSPKDDAEKNYCLTKQRQLDNQGSTIGKLGADALETLTIMIAALAAITVQTSKKPSTAQCPVYIGRQIEPILVAAGALLLIYAEVESFITFKKDCSDLLNAKGSDLATKIAAIDKKAGPDPTLSGSCTAETLKVEGQVSDYCRAKACTMRMKHAASKKSKHLGWAKSAYLSAATIEITNIIINLAKGAFCSIPYFYLLTCKEASWDPPDCYKYAIEEDLTVKEGLKLGSNKKTGLKLEEYLVDSLNFNIYQEKYNKAYLSQLSHSATYVETLILMDDFKRISEGAIASTTVDHYNFLNQMNINSFDSNNQIKDSMTMALQFANQLNPIQSANAKFELGEVMVSLGLVAGVSAVLMKGVMEAVMKVVKFAWKYPLGRVVYFGALYGLVQANQSVYEKRIVKELDERSKSFDEKITSLTGFVMPTMPGIDMPTEPAIVMPTPPNLPKMPKTKLPEEIAGNCIGEDKAPDKNCECVKNNKCLDMKMPAVTMPKGESLPGSVTDSMRNLRDGTNAMARGNLGKADLAGNNLNAGFSALAGDYNKLKKKLAEEQIKAKQTPHDIDGGIKKMQAEILKAVSEAMGSAPSVSGSSSGGGAGDSAKKKDEKESPTQTINTSSGGSGGGAAVGTAATAAKTDDMGLGLEEIATDDLGKLEEEGKVAGLDAYDFKAEDISKKSDENIFKNISSRYLKTAYPVLLQELKTEPVGTDK